MRGGRGRRREEGMNRNRLFPARPTLSTMCVINILFLAELLEFRTSVYTSKTVRKVECFVSKGVSSSRVDRSYAAPSSRPNTSGNFVAFNYIAALIGSNYFKRNALSEQTRDDIRAARRDTRTRAPRERVVVALPAPSW